MNDQSATTAGEECEKKLEEIEERQAEFDKLWLKMSGGDSSGAARYRELRHILDDLRADYRATCGELKESSSLPSSVVADWRS
jgi:hypothetical protein